MADRAGAIVGRTHTVGVSTEDGGTGLLSQLASLRRNRNRGSTAPHKPLLFLLALGRLRKNGSSELPWSVAEDELADLITRFTPPALTNATQRAAYPFTRLRTDGVWVLDRDVAMDSVRELNAGPVSGSFEPSLEIALREDPTLAREAARLLAAENFPEGEAHDVLNAVGLDAAEILGPNRARPDVIHTEESQPRRSRVHYELADYLDPAKSKARLQFQELLERGPVSGGERQAVFLPVETLLCFAASSVVNHRKFGGATAYLAPEPIPSLARLFHRPPASILAKMANLDNSRPNGARWDAEVGERLREQPTRFVHVYRMLLEAARAEGIGPDRLKDFLELDDETGELLGQDELGPAELEHVQAEIEAEANDTETERTLLATVRARQHLFARKVLTNCGDRCVFCGLSPAVFGGRRMLVAGHIKPWRDSTPQERLDHRNGLAACPVHDVAFDTGLLTVDAGLNIHLAHSLIAAIRVHPMVRQYYGRPPMLDTIQLPSWADPPSPEYLDWHRRHIFNRDQT